MEAVVAQPVLREPRVVRGLDRAAEGARVADGVWIGPPNVLGLPKPASSIRTRSTFGAPSGGWTWLAWFQSGVESASVRSSRPRTAVAGSGGCCGRLLRQAWVYVLSFSDVHMLGTPCLVTDARAGTISGASPSWDESADRARTDAGGRVHVAFQAGC